MKKYAEILTEIQNAKNAITDQTKAEKELCRLAILDARKTGDLDGYEIARAEYDAAVKRYEKEREQNETQKLKIEILKDNAAQAFFNENIATICDIWNKYEGKPHGEKTAQKIRDEIKAATGYRVYIGNRYDDANIKIYFDHETRAPFYDLEFVPVWDGNAKQPALVNNKVVKINANKMRVYCGHEYVENVDEHINAIRAAHAAAVAAENAFDAAVDAYNKLTRGNIQHASTREGVKKWLI